MNHKNKDYLNFKASSHLINNEKIVLSCMVTKYNESSYRQERTLVLTENAIYNIKKSQVKRRIALEKLDAITISTTTSEFVLHINDEYDYRYLSYEHRPEIIVPFSTSFAVSEISARHSKCTKWILSI